MLDYKDIIIKHYALGMSGSAIAPECWKTMIMNDGVSANSILKRVTKHYTVMIKSKDNN